MRFLRHVGKTMGDVCEEEGWAASRSAMEVGGVEEEATWDGSFGGDEDRGGEGSSPAAMFKISMRGCDNLS